MGKPQLKIVRDEPLSKNDMLDRAIAIWNTRQNVEWNEVKEEVKADGTKKAFVMDVRRRAEAMGITLRLGRQGRKPKSPPKTQIVIYDWPNKYEACADWSLFAENLANERDDEVTSVSAWEVGDEEKAAWVLARLKVVEKANGLELPADINKTIVFQYYMKVLEARELVRIATVTPDWRQSLKVRKGTN